MIKFNSFLLAAVLASTVTAAPAHDDKMLAMAAPAHGGQLRMAGPFHFELVVIKDGQAGRDNPLVVYVTDHAGQPVATRGGSGKALVEAAGIGADVPLRPDGDNRFRGVARIPSDPALKVSITITMPGQPAEKAKFAPLASR